MKQVRIGVGAGFSGDRLEAELPLVEWGEIGYLEFVCLTERSIGFDQADNSFDTKREYLHVCVC